MIGFVLLVSIYSVIYSIIMVVFVLQCSFDTRRVHNQPTRVNKASNYFTRRSVLITPHASFAILGSHYPGEVDSSTPQNTQPTQITLDDKGTEIVTSGELASNKGKSKFKKQKPKGMKRSSETSSIPSVPPAPSERNKTRRSRSHSSNGSHSSSLTREVIDAFKSAAKKKELGIADKVRHEKLLQRLPLEDRARLKQIWAHSKTDQARDLPLPSENADMKELDSDEEYFDKPLKSIKRKNRSQIKEHDGKQKTHYDL